MATTDVSGSVVDQYHFDMGKKNPDHYIFGCFFFATQIRSGSILPFHDTGPDPKHWLVVLSVAAFVEALHPPPSGL